MKRIIYFISWAVLTATDAILGYRTATTDFGIKDTILATVWALGFSLLSVPAKIIYDRLIEETYEKHPLIGKAIFTAFSTVWLFVAYNAYTGVSELRKKDMRREQLASIKLEVPKVDTQVQTAKIENQYNYRLAKAQMKIQATQDSIKFALQMSEQTKFREEQMKLVGETDSKGFLYFNLLLILSASICLSLAFKEDQEKASTSILEPLQDNHTSVIDIIEPVNVFEPKNEVEEVLPNKKNEKKGFPPYQCNCCGVVFTNRFGYNAHMKKIDTTCKKGNFTKLEIDYKPQN